MKNKIALTLLAVIALSGTSAIAQQHRNHDNMKNNRYMSQELNLTDEQRTQMQSLHESMRTENQKARETRQAEMQKFYDNPTFNADEAKSLAQKHRDDKAVRQMKHRHAMHQILTPEQRTKQMQMMQNHPHKKKRHQHNQRKDG